MPTPVETPGFIVLVSVNHQPALVEGPTHANEADAVNAAHALIEQHRGDSAPTSVDAWVIPATQVS